MASRLAGCLTVHWSRSTSSSLTRSPRNSPLKPALNFVFKCALYPQITDAGGGHSSRSVSSTTMGEVDTRVSMHAALHALDGMQLTVRQSKTDQEGAGSVHAIPRSELADRCSPCAFQRWAQIVSAFDRDGRPGVIRMLNEEMTFDEHVCLSVTSPALDSGPIWLWFLYL